MSTGRNKMSCTVMYQPYAMSSYSTCDRTSAEKKPFRFPYVPSPPDSLHSDGSSYSSPGPSSGGTNSSTTSQSQPNLSLSRRPLTPSSCGIPGPGSGSGAPATITSSSQLLQLQQQQRSPPLSISALSSQQSHHHHHSQSQSQNSQNRHGHTHSHSHNHSHNANSGSSVDTNMQRTSSSSASATITSHSHNLLEEEEGATGGNENEIGGRDGTAGGGGGNRAQYLSANCVVYENYRGDAARVVEEHFSRALSAGSSTKSLPMSTRNFPPSFWNSNYQPSSKPFVSYGSEFYGAAVDYGPSLTGLSHHHHQTDPWHYPLTSHQGYHHRPTDLSYPPMPSTSRFNAAQYGSFFLAGAAATSSAASRFAGMSGSSQCGVKGDGPSAWPSGLYHHPHDSLSELNLADYAAAAHYSNRTSGLETTVVGQESASKDPYWF